MKSKILLTSAAVLFGSVAGASALEFKPFIGLTMGLEGMVYSSAMDNAANNATPALELPQDFFTFGVEAGTHFGAYNEIYNYGFSFNADWSTNSDIDQKFADIKAGDLRTSSYSLTFDNYIRISGDKAKRIDLVLGAGVGTMNYHVNMIGGANETIYSPEFAFKAGMDFELNKHLILSANARLFAPTRSHYSVRAPYIVGGAIKYMF